MKFAKLKKLGNSIKFARKSKGLSQEDLAELMSKSRNYIGMIERAEINIPVLTLFQIAKILEVDIKDLF
ncbi:MAG: helix-turn-helix transcriptional regulator [bacterium]|nr:helix-turn-helix transcriptional regulator [bacterium]